MNAYSHMPRQTLVDELLSPVAVCERSGESVLARRLDVARELLLRNLSQDLESRPLMNSPEEIREWLRLYYSGVERETFVVLFLDTRHRLICAQAMFMGTIDEAEVYPREVVREAMRLNAAALCVSHNHPSGDPAPSAADRHLTSQLKSALRLVDVRLLDHFVVGARIVSMAEEGLM